MQQNISNPNMQEALLNNQDYLDTLTEVKEIRQLLQMLMTLPHFERKGNEVIDQEQLTPLLRLRKLLLNQDSSDQKGSNPNLNWSEIATPYLNELIEQLTRDKATFILEFLDIPVARMAELIALTAQKTKGQRFNDQMAYDLGYTLSGLTALSFPEAMRALVGQSYYLDRFHPNDEWPSVLEMMGEGLNSRGIFSQIPIAVAFYNYRQKTELFDPDFWIKPQEESKNYPSLPDDPHLEGIARMNEVREMLYLLYVEKTIFRSLSQQELTDLTRYRLNISDGFALFNLLKKHGLTQILARIAELAPNLSLSVSNSDTEVVLGEQHIAQLHLVLDWVITKRERMAEQKQNEQKASEAIRELFNLVQEAVEELLSTLAHSHPVFDHLVRMREILDSGDFLKEFAQNPNLIAKFFSNTLLGVFSQRLVLASQIYQSIETATQEASTRGMHLAHRRDVSDQITLEKIFPLGLHLNQQTRRKSLATETLLLLTRLRPIVGERNTVSNIWRKITKEAQEKFESEVNQMIELVKKYHTGLFLNDQEKKELETLVQSINQILKEFFITPEYFLLDRLNKNITQITTDQEPLESFTVELEVGQPAGLIGANGGGKSTLLATMIQSLYLKELVLGSRITTPSGSVRVLAHTDPANLQTIGERERFRVMAKSAFMAEIESIGGIFEELTARLPTTNDSPLLILTDEFGRRTDSLDGMALYSALLILVSATNSFSLGASHYNQLPHQLRPLLVQLGIKANWYTMENYTPRPLGNSEVVTSNAFGVAAKLLSPKLLEKWRELIGAEMLSQATYEYPKELPNSQQIMLTQLDWVESSILHPGRKTIHGLPRKLLGLDLLDIQLRKTKVGTELDHDLVLDILAAKKPELANFPTWVEQAQNLLDDEDTELAESVEALLELASTISLLEAGLQDTRDYNITGLLTSIVEFATTQKNTNFIQNVAKISDLFPGLEIDSLVPGLTALINYDFSSISDLLSKIADSKNFIAKVRGEIKDSSDKSELLKGALEFRRNILARELADLKKITSAFWSEVAGKLKPNYMTTLKLLDFAIVVGTNCKKLGYSKVVRNDGRNIEFHDLVSPSLKPEDGRVVLNDLSLRKTTFVTGPNGSGKTEFIRAVGETIILANAFGQTKSGCVLPEKIAVFPLLRVPEETTTFSSSQTRPFSALEKEVRYRATAMERWLDELEEGVLPVVVIDELGIATSEEDAEYLFRIVIELVEAQGGIVLASTHFHNIVREMMSEEKADVLSVEAFWTNDRYKVKPGHGQSKGLQTADQVGVPAPVGPIAQVIREYLVVSSTTGDNLESPAKLAAEKIQGILTEYTKV